MKDVFFRYRFHPESWVTEPSYKIALAASCGDKLYRAGLSFCNKQDLKKYDREKARSLALDRMNNDETVIIVSQREVDFYKGLMNAALVKVLTSAQRPHWFPVLLWNELAEVDDVTNSF